MSYYYSRGQNRNVNVGQKKCKQAISEMFITELNNQLDLEEERCVFCDLLFDVNAKGI